MFKKYVIILFESILKENLTFSQAIGICPILFCMHRQETSFLTFGIVFVISTILSIFIWMFDKFFLTTTAYINSLNVYILFFISTISTKFFEFFLKKHYSILYYRLGIILSLVSVHCNIFRSFVLYKKENICIILWILSNIGTSIGIILSAKIFFKIYQRIVMREIPFPFKGIPIIFITLGLISLIFMGLS